MPLAAGTRLGPYEISALIGRGGMGEVYRARDTKLGREVALKILPELFAAQPDRLARFEREAQVLASLNHPNIAAIYGFEEGPAEAGPYVRTDDYVRTEAGPSVRTDDYVRTEAGPSVRTDDAQPAARLAGVGPHVPPAVGSGFSRTVRALVLELVEGPTLADRIIERPIPADDAVPIARQIAEALAAAHEQGIVHRDLKPANIKVRPDGAVKVLDFGLAKLVEAGGGPSSGSGAMAALSMSPTLTSPAMTGAGVILGTAAYMAPEQVKGGAADKRSDLWAFGCVLYEMLTGLRAFRGDDVSDTFVAILRDEPDWGRLPADVPAAVRTLLERCLARDRRKRVADAQVALFLLDEPATAVQPAPAVASQSVQPPRWRRAAVVTAVALAASAVAAMAVWLATRPDAPTVVRFTVPPPDNMRFSVAGRTATSGAISPDGRTLAFTARDVTGRDLLWVRPIDALEARPLTGTEGAYLPFWSPDSRFIGYFAQDRVLKIPAGGGPPLTLSAAVAARGGTWGVNDVIVFGTDAGLVRVGAAGGQPVSVSTPEKGQTVHRFPWFLPDSRHILYYVGGPEEVSGVYVIATETGESRRLTGADSAAVYDARSRRVLFVRQGTLLAQPFDPDALTLAGDPFPVAERLESSAVLGLPAFSLSDTGVLAYGTGSGYAGMQLVWVDRGGKPVGTVGDAAAYRGIDLDPDGRRVAFHRHDSNAGGDIWVTDLSRGTTSRFTFDASQDNSSPIWSPDGQRIAFASLRAGKWGLYEKPAGGAGAETKLAEFESVVMPMGWSPDGRAMVYWANNPKTAQDLEVLRPGQQRGPAHGTPLVNTPFIDSHAQVSPDGRWVAYFSNETGQPEVYVQPLSGGSGKWQVSNGGGIFPRWRGDGRELFYMSQLSQGRLMAVDVRVSGDTFEAGTPRELFDTGYVNLGHVGNYHTYAVSRDGQRFLIPRPVGDASRTDNPLVVVLNWAQAK
jgi:serine/threonine protein kinase/Tol biopolymer transport system component